MSVLGLGVANVIAFDGGRLVLANSFHAARVLPATATLDATFGRDGVVDLPAITGVTSPAFDAFAVGADGTMVIARTGMSHLGDDGDRNYSDITTRYIHLLNADGTPTQGFGTAGVLTETASSYRMEEILNYTQRQNFVRSMAIAPDGALLRTVDSKSASDSGSGVSRSESLNLERRDGAGVIVATADLAGTFRPESFYNSPDAEVLINAKGSAAYVRFDNRLWRGDAKTLKADEGYNGAFGAASLGSVFNGSRAILDAQGRLLVVGLTANADGLTVVDRPLEVRVYRGAAASFGTLAGSSTLLPGGLLDVAGTTGHHVVRLRRVKGKLQVEVNGKAKRFDFADVSGIIIHTTAGKDTVAADRAQLGIGVTVQAGAGQDRITGTDRDDLIDAGAGNDLVNALSGVDIVYGQSGKDTLVGGYSADCLYGGADDDTLWSSNSTGSDNDGDNYLFGGGGKDTFIASSHRYANFHNSDRLEQ